MNYTEQDIREEAYKIYQRRKTAFEPDADDMVENWRRAESFLRQMDKWHRG